MSASNQPSFTNGLGLETVFIATVLIATVMTLSAGCAESSHQPQVLADAGRTGAEAGVNPTSGMSSDDAAVTDVSVALDAGEPSQDTASLARDAASPALDAAALDAGLDTASLDGGNQTTVDAGLVDASGDDAGETSHHDVSLDATVLIDAGESSPCGDLAPSYSSGLVATGPNGVQVTLNEAEPAPPVVGLNVFYLSIRDDAGDTVSGAELTVTPYMPQHHHGSPSVPESEQIENGTFRVTQVEFTMPGFWEITIDVSGGGVTDSVRLKLCI